LVKNKELQPGGPHENIPEQQYKCGNSTGYSVGCAQYKRTEEDPCPTELKVK